MVARMWEDNGLDIPAVSGMFNVAWEKLNFGKLTFLVQFSHVSVLMHECNW